MASIGEDDLFDEDIVTQYLKEVTFITQYNLYIKYLFVWCNSDEEDKEKEQENNQGPRLRPCHCAG